MKSEFKKIAIICASERELAPFLPLIENPTISERAMLRIHEGRLNGFEVAAVYCGVCKVNAAAAAQIMIDCYGADTVISAGASGGMAEDLQLFDTVVAAEACYHDVHERILTDYHPFMKTQFFPASSELVSAAKAAAKPLAERGQRIFFGRTATGEAFIADEGRADINSRLAPLAVDMESAAIAHVCYLNGVRFIAVRCITDTANTAESAHLKKTVPVLPKLQRILFAQCLMSCNQKL